MVVSLGMEGEHGQNYNFITNGLYAQAWVLFCVQAWSTKVANGKEEGVWVQSTKVAYGKERVKFDRHFVLQFTVS